MAICPNCKGTMGQTDARCPECGYDFPDTSPKVPKTGLAYSKLADISLIFGGVAAGMGCICAVGAGIISVIEQTYSTTFFFAPVSFFLCLAMLVVFIRIQNI